jgi:hypothetical protein
MRFLPRDAAATFSEARPTGLGPRVDTPRLHRSNVSIPQYI